MGSGQSTLLRAWYILETDLTGHQEIVQGFGNKRLMEFLELAGVRVGRFQPAMHTQMGGELERKRQR
jgi:hypothetical protein